MDSSAFPAMFGLVAAQFGVYAACWFIGRWLVPEERVAASHWSLFSLLAALGMLLTALRTPEREWWPYAGANIAFLLCFVVQRRGVEAFVRQTPRDREHVALLLLGGGAVAWLGAAEDMAPARVAVSYASLAVVLLRAVLTVLPAVRREFGPRLAVAVVAPALLTGAIFLLRTLQQLADPTVPLEMHRHETLNADLLFGYIVAAGMFNFAFLSMVLLRLLNQLRRHSRQDPLTGLLNRRALEVDLDREWKRFRRGGVSFAALAIDVDHFKAINDSHGHEAGDQVLVGLAQLLRGSARQVDIAARLGGEEFLLVLAEAESNGALEAAQRLRQRLAAAVFDGPKPDVRVTVSIGVAIARPNDGDVHAVLKRADAALYRAKAEGRDRVCLADDGAPAAAG
jgi:diguanylate cyclase (GGDEF)-like protein